MKCCGWGGFDFVAEVSKSEGRVGQTTNMVIGGTVADDSTKEWMALDQKVFYFYSIRLALEGFAFHSSFNYVMLR